jgi:hypothetical protein
MISPLPSVIATPQGPSVHGAGPELLGDLLEQLEQSLRDAGVPVLDYFQPRASREEVQRAFEECGLLPSEEAVVWFDWHNGDDGYHRSLPWFDFWPLETVRRRRLDPGGQKVGVGDWMWHPDWIQLMGDNNGVAISRALDEKGREQTLVRALSISDPEWSTQPSGGAHQVVSLCTPVTWWIESLRAGWYQWDRVREGWHIDDAKQPEERRTYGLS